MSYTFPSYEHIENIMSFDILHSFTMCHHCEVVSIHLKDFVVFFKAAMLRWRILIHLGNVDALQIIIIINIIIVIIIVSTC